MDDLNDEQVATACGGYHNAVRAWMQRNSYGDPNEVTVLLRHITHLVHQLTIKRKSLQAGLSVLEKEVWPEVLRRYRQTYTNANSKSTLEANKQTRIELLEHFLVSFLRLHDGVFLLVSGECRHEGDIQIRKKTSFPSNLSSGEHRPDGYTKLFNAPSGYSGYGWDEFHDERMGLQARLLHAMARSYKNKSKRPSTDRISKYILEHGGEALDNLFSMHENQMHKVKDDFQSLRNRVVLDLKQVCDNLNKYHHGNFRDNILFNLHDKMEKLQVDDVVITRRGNAFQVRDPQGALPSGYTIQDWKRVIALPPEQGPKQPEQQSTQPPVAQVQQPIKLPSRKLRKRRLVIQEDSSSDEDDGVLLPAAAKDDTAQNHRGKTPKTESEEPVKPTEKIAPSMQHIQIVQKANAHLAKPAISGLNVKVQKEQSPKKVMADITSLASIKAQMGVDTQGLEKAREELENEEAGTTQAAADDEEQEERLTITAGERKIQACRRQLTGCMSKGQQLEERMRKGENIPNDVQEQTWDEVWNCRDLLREALMEVGNLILWSSNPDHRKTGLRKEALERAFKFFRESQELVKQQELIRGKTSGSQEESWYRERNLLLLLGRAHTNMAITKIELASLAVKYKRSKCLQEAIDELGYAKGCADAMRVQASIHKSRTISMSAQTDLECLLADQLKCLASRWKGTALWRQGKLEEAAQELESAAGCFMKSQKGLSLKSRQDETIIKSLLNQVGSESYFAGTTLADLASATMEEITITPTGAVKAWEGVLLYVKVGLDKASTVSNAIKECIESHPAAGSTYAEFCEENSVLSCEGISQYMSEILAWWDRRKAMANRPIVVDPILEKHEGHRRTTRSDVVPMGLEKLPTRRFLVREDSSNRRRKKRRGANPMYSDNFNGLTHSVESNQLNDQAEGQPQRFRPWGDELLLQTVDEATGQSMPKIVYPAIAPPMPPEIRTRLAATALYDF